MDQQTDNWLEWRKKGIGASDAPIVMGVSPWKTPFQLWEEKTGRTKPQPTNRQQQRGIDMEQKARAHYEFDAGVEMPPVVAEHETHRFLRASLDGFNSESKKVLEIKCPGQKDHATALAGAIPEKYYPQIQHQLMVTGAYSADYYSFDGNKGVTVNMAPDTQYIKTLFAAEKKFWQCVTTDTPPALTDRDFIVVNSDKDLEILCNAYKMSKINLDIMKTNVDRLRTQLVEKISHPRARVNGLQVVRYIRAGSVDYSKVPELSGVNLDKYRKKSTEVTTVTVMKT